MLLLLSLLFVPAQVLSDCSPSLTHCFFNSFAIDVPTVLTPPVDASFCINFGGAELPANETLTSCPGDGSVTLTPDSNAFSGHYDVCSITLNEQADIVAFTISQSAAGGNAISFTACDTLQFTTGGDIVALGVPGSLGTLSSDPPPPVGATGQVGVTGNTGATGAPGAPGTHDIGDQICFFEASAAQYRRAATTLQLSPHACAFGVAPPHAHSSDRSSRARPARVDPFAVDDDDDPSKLVPNELVRLTVLVPYERRSREKTFEALRCGPLVTVSVDDVVVWRSSNTVFLRSGVVQGEIELSLPDGVHSFVVSTSSEHCHHKDGLEFQPASVAMVVIDSQFGSPDIEQVFGDRKK